MSDILFFPYFGPSRRSDHRVVEIRLGFDSTHLSEFPQKLSLIKQQLFDAGVLKAAESYPQKPLPEEKMAWYPTLLAQTALLLQRKTGHRVNYYFVSCEQKTGRCTAIVEHEHSTVGMAAVELAISVFSSNGDILKEAWQSFSGFAREHVLPLETEAIINVVRRRNIPFFQLEREPLSGKFNTGFRVRRNGLLSLGHGVNCRVIDGSFCLDLAGDFQKALLRNSDQRMALLRQLEIPISQEVDKGTEENKSFTLLFIDGKVTAVEHFLNDKLQHVVGMHESWFQLCQKIAEKVGIEPIAVKVLAQDIAQSLESSGAKVLDFELAPDLGQLLGHCDGQPDLLDSVAANLVDYLFPDHIDGRIRTITVTGTNGKTTTCRMINHILHKSGRKPGLVCTDGVFLNGRQASDGDASSFIGHARVLTSKQVDAAVLETHHRGIAVRGFAFDNCDISVCLNVTSEHLQEGEIETVEQMAVIKRALLERATEAVVLFADDSHCMAMLDQLTAPTVCLVSLESDIEQLRRIDEQRLTHFCVLETIADEEWIILYSRQSRLTIMPVAQIPATFNGSARFNVSNAMHAIAASYLSGTSNDLIRLSLSMFNSGQEMTPGRMNVFDHLPFRIIIDFAHNPDGMIKVCDFVDRQSVAGRKLIAFSGSGKRQNDVNREVAQAVSGHFDFYFCKDYQPAEPPIVRFMASFMQKVLIEEGVAENQTTVLTFGRDEIYKIFDACVPGDLLLMLLGHVEKHTVPGYIRDYSRR